MEDQPKKTIARSTINVTRDSLATIFELVGKYRWLKEKSERLASLIDECQSESESDLVIHLLSEFRYFDSYDLNSALDRDLPKIETAWDLSPKDTVFSALARDNNLDSGAMFLSGARNRLSDEDWTKEHFYSKFFEIDFEKENWIKKIVLCDDFTGTAKTLNNKVTWLRKRLSSIGAETTEVYFFGLVCMNFSIPIVEELVDKHHFCELLKKGISDHFDGDALKAMMNASSSMEGNLGMKRKLKKLSMGFKKSESLYNLADTNIPNNVFPILWWPVLDGGSPRDRLFKRVL